MASTGSSEIASNTDSDSDSEYHSCDSEFHSSLEDGAITTAVEASSEVIPTTTTTTTSTADRVIPTTTTSTADRVIPTTTTTTADRVIPTTTTADRVIDVPTVPNLLRSMKDNPATFVIPFRPSFFSYPCIFSRVYYRLSATMLMILAITFFLADIFGQEEEEEEVPVWSAVTTGVFVSISVVLFLAYSYFFCSSGEIRGKVFEWLLEAQLIIAHILSGGYAIYSVHAKPEYGQVQLASVILGLAVSFMALSIRLFVYIKRCKNFYKLTRVPEVMLLIIAAKSLQESMVQYNTIYQNMQRTMELVGGEKFQEFVARDQELRNELRALNEEILGH